MKILWLRFRNLNSLVGDWSIDFSAPAYTEGVIFAIIGPTGSGKTTILDAISLALYGKTPRLKDITKTTNEIMSRRTGECYAEVAFETAKGRFLCHWSQQRARRHAKGDLQQPRHEISDLKTKKLLTSSKRKEVLDKIVEVTGLDFEQFTRSILLAQGGFAAFLEAKPDDRSPILEQITGTGIYSTISIRVHERTAEERKTLETRKLELGSIQVLTPEEEQTFHDQQITLAQEAREVSLTIKSVQDSIAWHKRLDAIQQDLQKLHQEKAAHEEEKLRASDDLRRLCLGKKAHILEAEFVKLTAQREQLAQDQEAILECRNRKVTLEAGFKSAEAAEREIADKKQKIAVEWDDENRLAHEVRTLDTRIEAARDTCQRTAQELQDIIRRSAEYEVLITDREQQLWNTSDTLEEIGRYLSAHENESTLKENLVVLEEYVKQYRELDKKYAKKNSHKKGLAEGHDTASLTVTRLTAEQDMQKESLRNTVNKRETQEKELHVLLNGEDLSSWHEKETTLRAGCETINRLNETLCTAKKFSEERSLKKTASEKFEETLITISQTLASLVDEIHKKETLVEHLEETTRLLARIRNLEKERALLQTDQPCPLCGSTVHPFTDGTVPIVDEKEAELKREKKVLKSLRDHHSRVAIDHGKTETAQAQAREDILILTGHLEECGTSWKTKITQPEPGTSVISTLPGTLWDPKILEETQAYDFSRSAGAITQISGIYEKELAACHALILDVTSKEKEQKTIERAINAGNEALAKMDLALQAAQSDCQKYREEIERLDAEIKENRIDLEQYRDMITRILVMYGYPAFDPLRITAIKKVLVKQCKEYQVKIRTREELGNDKTRLAADIDAYTTSFMGYNKDRRKKRTQLTEQEQIREDFARQRFAIYGEKNPADEEARYKELKRTVEAQAQTCSAEKNALEKQLHSVNDQVTHLTESIQSGTARLDQLSGAFQNSLQAQGFVDEPAFMGAALPQKTLNELAAIEESLRTRETRIETSLRDKQDAVARETERHLTDRSLPELTDDEQALRSRHDALQHQLGAIDRKLADNAQEKERMAVRLSAVAAQEKECLRWERLHALIGSADGKKFRNFAQGLTFEILIAHANRHLQKMSDRYLLVKNPDVLLDLSVIDNYQVGECRSTKNLSGGESFILSLALALGLSGMASHKVRIDSFFLDEGFGTLDDESLDTALVTLSLLQQEGKLIGVISHVAAIKERIGTQIVVEKCTGGRSRITGPGCTFKSY